MAENVFNDRALQSYLSEIAKIKPLSREKEIELAIKANQGDKKALDKLVTANLKFVVKVAARYQNRGLTLSELISEGNAREFIRRVQDLRKEAGFEIADRIEVYFEANDALTRAVNSNSEYIRGEVLAVLLDGTKIPSGVSTPEDELKIDGEILRLGIKKVLL